MTVKVASDLNTNGARNGSNGKPNLTVADWNVFLNQRSPLASTHPNHTCLTPLRDMATHQLNALSFPTTRDEEWRFTDVSPLLSLDWDTTLDKNPLVTLDEIQPHALTGTGSIIVVVNGEYQPDLSAITDRSGVTIHGLSEAGGMPSKTFSYLGKQHHLERTFTALNTASFTDGVVIWMDKKATTAAPIHLLSITTAQANPRLTHPRVLVVAEAHSEVTLLEDYIALGEGAYVTNPVTEIYVEENAHVNHVRVQRDGQEAFHIGKTAVSQAENSHYACHAISIGSQISRHHLEIFQTGIQTETLLNGLSMISGQQVADTHSLIAYEHPHSMSRQLHKTIVDGSAHAVFNGKVKVPQAAQLTDAGQLNRNLLLSPKGKVDTKPQLEIVADNVKCTHGATVSQLKADEVFYLQSRGIDATRAQNLLIYAFAAEILDGLPIESLKQQLAERVDGFIQTP